MLGKRLADTLTKRPEYTPALLGEQRSKRVGLGSAQVHETFALAIAVLPFITSRKAPSFGSTSWCGTLIRRQWPLNWI